MATAISSTRFLLGLGLGIALAAPVISLADITIPQDPFTGGTAISADDMNAYMNQLREHLQGEIVVTDYVPDRNYDEITPQVVAELQTPQDLNTVGGPVRIDFVPQPFSGVGAADPAFIEASSTVQYCAAFFDIERQTDGGEWVSVGHDTVFGGGSPNDTGCAVRVPPGALSMIDVSAGPGAHRYRLRTWSEGGFSNNIARLKDFRMVVYELRGVLPAT